MSPLWSTCHNDPQAAPRRATRACDMDFGTGSELVRLAGHPSRPTYFLEWLLYPWQLPLLRDKGILRLPVGNARHAPTSRRTREG